MKVKIPFLKEFKVPMLSGKKTATSRTKRYGQRGDTFKAFGAMFQIKDVSKMSLGMIANEYYLDEGFISDNEFVQCWRKLHPRKGYVPDQMVWVHIFEKEAPQ